MAKKLRCFVGLYRWVEKVDEQARYAVCRDCGRKPFFDKVGKLPFGGV